MSGTNDSRVILTTSTVGNEYYEALLVFLLSLRVAGGYSGKVIVDLINGGPKESKEIDKAYPGVVINHITIPQITMLSTMYTRPNQIMNALDAGYQQIAAIDTDIIVRNDMSGIWENLGPGTVKVWDKKALPPIFPNSNVKKYWYAVKVPKLAKKDLRARIQGGVQLYGNGEVTKAFYAEFMRRLGEQFRFWDGQIILYRMIQKRYAGIKFVNLGSTYNDSLFNDGTVLWHAKHKHFTDRKWAKETAKWKSRLSAL
jgi:hypothetical protein